MGITFKEYIEYHKNLAECHKDIQHQEKKNHGFFTTDSGEFLNMMNDSSNRVSLNVLHLLPLKGKISGDEDFSRETLIGGFTLLSRIKWEKRNYQEQDEVWSRAKEIGLQIIAKIQEDSLNGGCEKLLECFDIDQVKFEQVGPIQNHSIGWEFTYPVSSRESIKHNSDKWLSK